MQFLPYESFYIITKLKPDEIQARLEKIVSQDDNSVFSFRNWTSTTRDTVYKGYAVNGAFEVERNIGYRNSFNPEIEGHTQANVGGSRIEIKMRLKIFVIVFLFVWLGIAGIGSLKSIPELLSAQRTGSDLIPFGMFVFGYLLTLGGFKYESIKSKSFLLVYLKAN